jgi:hypothetical protein
MTDSARPFPQFYVFRPDQKFVPLIPLDELPEWLQLYNLDWQNDMSIFDSMTPVTLTLIPRAGEYDMICRHCTESLENITAFQRAQLNASLSASSSGSSGNHSLGIGDLRSPVSYPGVFVFSSPQYLEPSPINSAPSNLSVYRQHHPNRNLSNAPLNHWLSGTDPASGIVSPISLTPNPLIPIQLPPSNYSFVSSSLNPEAESFRPSINLTYRVGNLNEGIREDESDGATDSSSSAWSSLGVEEPKTQPTSYEPSPMRKIPHLALTNRGKVSGRATLKQSLKGSEHNFKQRPKIRVDTSICSENPCFVRGKKEEIPAVEEKRRYQADGIVGNGRATTAMRKCRPRRVRLGYHVRRRSIPYGTARLNRQSQSPLSGQTP